MESPTFIQIWNDLDWFKYWEITQPKHTREYYKFRSVCRMAFWIPVVTVTVYMFLSVVSVYS
jgi:hypothetical protein